MSRLSQLKQSVLAVAVSQVLLAPMEAAEIIVDGTEDTIQIDGSCTLREAILSAEMNAGDDCVAGSVFGRDVITFSSDAFPPTVYNLLPLTESLPTITSSVSISGVENSGIVLDVGGNGRVLQVEGGDLNLTRLTLQGAVLTSMSDFGGGLLITDASNVSLDSCVIRDNMVAGQGAGMFIRDESQVVITRSTISGNTATSPTLPNEFSLTGGAAAFDSYLRVYESTIHDNFAEARGGGLRIQGGSALLRNSTVSTNSVDIDNDNFSTGAAGVDFSSAHLTIVNSTVTGNFVVGTGVGGLGQISPQSLTIINSIISGNDGSAANEIGLNGTEGLVIRHSILGDSSDVTGNSFTGFIPTTDQGSILATIDGSRPTDLANILTPLADNGGPSLTHNLVPGSPALGNADISTCPAKDQRGKTRNADDLIVPIVATNGGVAVINLGSDGKCDIGAVEF